ncbi:hypothetical protein BX265_7654 [Streptomyces sp. TLI_235]|nr:hypothetical protein [Streptomyces sp. TLI_235]PBC70256.1 hypothetical protein BX265_7654 [Streptomyces sp. TLI_235]
MSGLRWGAGRVGGVPRPHSSNLIPQAADALATEHAERGRVPVLIIAICQYRGGQP